MFIMTINSFCYNLRKQSLLYTYLIYFVEFYIAVITKKIQSSNKTAAGGLFEQNEIDFLVYLLSRDLRLSTKPTMHYYHSRISMSLILKMVKTKNMFIYGSFDKQQGGEIFKKA